MAATAAAAAHVVLFFLSARFCVIDTFFVRRRRQIFDFFAAFVAHCPQFALYAARDYARALYSCAHRRHNFCSRSHL